MGVRETVGKKQWVVGVGAVVVILAAAAAIIVQARSYGTGPAAGATYYTADDGASFFVGDGMKLAPFDHEGKQAVRAHVFECGGKRVVGYMSRYTADALATLADAKAARASDKPPANIGKLASIGTTGIELKRPRDAKWITAGSPGAPQIRVFKCSDGKVPPEVFPE